MIETTRVYWTEEEREKLIAGVTRLRLTDIRSTLLQLLNRVQTGVIAPDRQRHLNTVETIPWLEKAVIERINSLRKPSEPQAPVQKVESVKIPTRAEVLADTPTLELLQTLLLRAQDSFDDLKRYGLDLQQLLRVAVSPTVSNPAPAPVTALEQKTYVKPKPRVLIVGLTPSQATHIKEQFDERFNLTVIDNDDSRSGRVYPLADVAYVMVKQVGQHVYDTVVARIGKAKAHQWVAGIGELSAKLREL